MFSTTSDSLLQDWHCSQALGCSEPSALRIWPQSSSPGGSSTSPSQAVRMVTARSPWGAKLVPIVFSGRTLIQAKDFGMCPTSKLAFRVHFGRRDLNENPRPKPAWLPQSHMHTHARSPRALLRSWGRRSLLSTALCQASFKIRQNAHHERIFLKTSFLGQT